MEMRALTDINNNEFADKSGSLVAYALILSLGQKTQRLGKTVA